jgi:DNA-directed RNA polymerase II subunit RPB2
VLLSTNDQLGGLHIIVYVYTCVVVVRVTLEFLSPHMSTLCAFPLGHAWPSYDALRKSDVTNRAPDDADAKAEESDGGSFEHDLATRKKNNDMVWACLKAFLDQCSVAKQQIGSFDEFIKGIRHDVEDSSVIESFPDPSKVTQWPAMAHKITLSFSDVDKPTMSETDGSQEPMIPNEARLRYMTYSGPLYLDAKKETFLVDSPEDRQHPERWELKSTHQTRVMRGKIPVMFRSAKCNTKSVDMGVASADECSRDEGGYFIINGSEKILTAQEKMSTNCVHIFPKKGGSGKPLFVAEIRSSATNRKSPSTVYARLIPCGKGNMFTIRIIIPYIRQEIPFGVLMRALGCETDESMVRHVLTDGVDIQMFEMLRPSIEEAYQTPNQAAALDYISKRGGPNRQQRSINDLVHREVFPHIGVTRNDSRRKCFYLGHVVQQLIRCYTGEREVDDRDHCANKRLDLAGPLLGGLNRQLNKKANKETATYMRRFTDQNKDFNLSVALRTTSITKGLKYALSTGNWGVGKVGSHGSSNRTGVSQVLIRHTHMSAHSHAHRSNTPIGREGKNPKPRQLHNTHWGAFCPAETPEGQACGLVKNLTIMTYVTVGSPPDPVIRICERLGVSPPEKAMDTGIIYKPNIVKVFVNGNPIGVTGEPVLLTNQLRALRRCGDISHEVSICWNIQERMITIVTDTGRPCRPYFVVKNNRILYTRHHYLRLGSKGVASMTWQDLLNEGVVEYLDTAELERSMVAMPNHLETNIDNPNGKYIRYTHAEIHSATILGTCASIIPFPDHNQSPRNTYQSAMGKQAMGVYATNFRKRLDTMAHILYYPQKPLVSTKPMEIMNLLPAGQNGTVAIASHTGFNQEDAKIGKRTSFDFGWGRSVYFRSFRAEEKKQGSTYAEQFGKPEEGTCIQMKHGNYGKIENDGIVPTGTWVSSDNVLIGKWSPIPTDATGLNVRGSQRITRKDDSTTLRGPESGVVDSVIMTTNQDSMRFTKVRTRSTRIPQKGDKFSSRHGQKGILGNTIHHEDAFYTAGGDIATVIMNPHAVPSRMTIGQPMESNLSKACERLGTFGDGTAFNGMTPEDIREHMVAAGLSPTGTDLVYSGTTGEPIEAEIFQGPTHYQRLKHMVVDKVHSRNRGPVQIKTLQPQEGRARDGGFRFGEMERDCLAEDHQILTSEGFLFLDQVKQRWKNGQNIQVCGYDRTTKRLVYEKPHDLIVKPAKTQTMVSVRCGDIDILVTPKHDLFVDTGDGYQKTKATNLLKMNRAGFMTVVKQGDVLVQHTVDVSKYVNTQAYTGRTWCVSVPHGMIVVRRATAIDRSGAVLKSSVPVIMGNCMLAHGAAQFLLERLFYESDPFTMPICIGCGFPCHSTTFKGNYTCRICKTQTNIRIIPIPYACRLLFTELMAMNVGPRMFTKEEQ